MGMMLEISSTLIDAIRAEAAAVPDAEVCGLLLGRGARVERIVPCRNVAEDPDTSFEIDPQALISAYKAARSGGPAMIGHYHSHPNGKAEPSARDAANATGDGAIWIIVGGDRIAAWQSNSPGRLSPIDM